LLPWITVTVDMGGRGGNELGRYLNLIDASGPGGNQLPSAPFKSKAQSRSRRDLQGASSSASLRSEPGSRKYPSKGSRKGKNGDDLEQVE